MALGEKRFPVGVRFLALFAMNLALSLVVGTMHPRWMHMSQGSAMLMTAAAGFLVALAWLRRK
jgi:hypothetical protein